MEMIRDPKEIQKARELLQADRFFSSDNLNFYICRFEKGEFLSSPLAPLTHLLILMSGSIQIYGLSSESQIIPVNLSGAGTLIGDLEYATGNNSLFGEAKETVYCLALSIEESRTILDQDIQFLHYLIDSLAQKVYLSSGDATATVSVEEKLLSYMKNRCPDQILRGVGDATLHLRCSRRQLQRTLAELCKTGEIVKIARGTYQLIDKKRV